MYFSRIVTVISAALVVLSIGCGSSAPRASQADSYAHYDSRSYAFESEEIQGELVSADSASSGGSSSSSPARKPASSPDPRVDYDRKFVKNAWVELEVDDEDDFEPTVARIQEVAEGLGGYAVETSRSSITAKVPTERLDEAMVSITSVADVVEKNVRVSDVTARYVDLQIRISNLEKVRDRLQELVAQGEDVKAILEVEKELNRVTRELESLKGQMRMLSNQVTFATINVSISEDVTPGPIGWIFYGGYKAIKWLFVWD